MSGDSPSVPRLDRALLYKYMEPELTPEEESDEREEGREMQLDVIKLAIFFAILVIIAVVLFNMHAFNKSKSTESLSESVVAGSAVEEIRE